MSREIAIGIVAFVVVCGLTLLIAAMVARRRRHSDRMRTLVSADVPGRPEQDGLSQFVRGTLPALGRFLLAQQKEGTKNTQLQNLLIQAGFYKVEGEHDEHLKIFLAVKSVMSFVAPVLFGVGALLRLWEFSMQLLVIAGFLMLVIGSLPTIWLNRQKEKRQAILRNTLPDALDVIMICLEGGLTLSGALVRIATELRTVHPDLAVEMNIVQRHIQMGRSAGEALRQFANRCDLDEARSLASAVLQSERFGASLVAAVRVQADMLRLRRIQQAEERAHKASVQVLFPTLLLIFPAVFIVLVGPAGLQIVEIFAKMNAAAEVSTTTDFPTLP